VKLRTFLYHLVKKFRGKEFIPRVLQYSLIILVSSVSFSMLLPIVHDRFHGPHLALFSHLLSYFSIFCLSIYSRSDSYASHLSGNVQVYNLLFGCLNHVFIIPMLFPSPCCFHHISRRTYCIVFLHLQSAAHSSGHYSPQLCTV